MFLGFLFPKFKNINNLKQAKEEKTIYIYVLGCCQSNTLSSLL